MQESEAARVAEALRAYGLIAHPRTEGLIQQAIFVFAEIAFIDGHRQRQQKQDQHKLQRVNDRLQRFETRQALRHIAHPPGNSAAKKKK